MKKVDSVEEYIENNSHFGEALTLLRSIILKTELNESIKWSAPVYDLNGKNVVGLGAFKQHFSIWFFNGVFLKDEHNRLVNAQENKTKALRQMRFTSLEDIDKNLVLDYVKKAIENQKLGKEIKPIRNTKAVVIPEELKRVFKAKTEVKSSFKTLSAGKQKEYCSYIADAKREATKQTRIDKIIPMILKGVGLNDKYKNC